jgi:hypothetical protein
MSRVRKGKTMVTKWDQKSNSVSGVVGRAREYETIRSDQIGLACDAWLLKCGIVPAPFFQQGRAR